MESRTQHVMADGIRLLPKVARVQSAFKLLSAQRNLVHASALLVPVLVEATSKILIMAALSVLTAVYVLEEFLRLKGMNLPLMTQFTSKMSRPNEKAHFITRPAYLACGVILALLLFPKSVAYASIVIVAIGDPIAGYVGGKFGQRRIGRKSLEGFIAGFVTAFLTTLLVIAPILGAIGSIAGMLIELTGIWDDNFMIPVGAGIAMIAANSVLHFVVA